MISFDELVALADRLEAEADFYTAIERTSANYWFRVARAAETLAAQTLSAAGLGENYYVRRAVEVLEPLSGTTGAEESDAWWGWVKRLVDADEALPAPSVAPTADNDNVRVDSTFYTADAA